MKRILCLAILVSVPFAAGCRVYHRGYVVHDAPTVYHVHGSGCGHVYYGGTWVESGRTTVYGPHHIAPRVVITPPVPVFRPWHRVWIGPRHDRGHHHR